MKYIREMSIFNSMYADKIQQMKDYAKPENGLEIFNVGNTYIILEIVNLKKFYDFEIDTLNLKDFGNYKHHISNAHSNLRRLYLAADYELSNNPYMVVGYSLNDKVNFLYGHNDTRQWLHHLEKHDYEYISSLDGEELYEQIKDNNLSFDKLKYAEKLKVLNYMPSFINKIKILDDQEFMELVKDANINSKSLDQANTLRFNKLSRSEEDKEYYDNSDFFAFLAKDKFVEVENGMYQKDTEIENLYKIDPDSVESNQAVGMMKIRCRFQQDVSLYILTTTKGTLAEFYDNGWAINKPEYKWIRDAIMQKAKKIMT